MAWSSRKSTGTMRATRASRHGTAMRGRSRKKKRTPPAKACASNSCCTKELAPRLEHARFGQREAVELARVGRRVGAGVADVDEVTLLQVRGQRLVAQDHVDRVAGRAGHVPGDVGPGAVGANLVLEALGGLDHAAEQARIPVHPALAA